MNLCKIPRPTLTEVGIGTSPPLAHPWLRDCYGAGTIDLIMCLAVSYDTGRDCDRRTDGQNRDGNASRRRAVKNYRRRVQRQRVGIDD